MTARRRWNDEERKILIDTVDHVVNRGEKTIVGYEVAAALLGRTIDAVRYEYNVIKRAEKATVEPAIEAVKEPVVTPVKEIVFDSVHPALHAVSNHINKLENENQTYKDLSDLLLHQNEELESKVAKAEEETNQLLMAINRSRRSVFEKVFSIKDERNFKRGEIWMAELGSMVGSEQSGERPVLIIQNDIGNAHSPTVIVAAVTDGKKRPLPTHANIQRTGMLTKDSVVMLEQISTISKDRLIKRIAIMPANAMKDVSNKILISFGIGL